MRFIIDRIESGIAVCECLDSDDNIEITVKELPKGAKEGDALVVEGNRYTIDVAFTAQRKAMLANRLDKLFKKHNPT